jgi:hypothetical protein
MTKKNLNSVFILLLLLQQVSFSSAIKKNIKHDRAAKTITVTTPDKSLSVLIDYSSGCIIKQLNIKGNNTLSPSGIYSGVQTKSDTFSSADNLTQVQVTETTNGVTLKGINYGDNTIGIKETWSFKLDGNKIRMLSWKICLSQNGILPTCQFGKAVLLIMAGWFGVNI